MADQAHDFFKDLAFSYFDAVVLVWLVVGLAIYFGYGKWHSRLGLAAAVSIQSPPPLAGEG